MIKWSNMYLYEASFVSNSRTYSPNIPSSNSKKPQYYSKTTTTRCSYEALYSSYRLLIKWMWHSQNITPITLVKLNEQALTSRDEQVANGKILALYCCVTHWKYCCWIINVHDDILSHYYYKVRHFHWFPIRTGSQLLHEKRGLLLIPNDTFFSQTSLLRL